MKNTSMILVLCLLLSVATFAFAGEKGKCNENAVDSVNALVAKIQQKGWVGIETEKNDHGYYTVRTVVADSPAEKAGFQAGDVLVALNGIELTSENKAAFKAAKAKLGPGAKATYTVKRSSGKHKVAVTLGHVPEAVMAEWIGYHMIENHLGDQIAAR